MDCPNCKRKNDQDAIYCKVCGEKLPPDQRPWYKRNIKKIIFYTITALFVFSVYRTTSTLLSDIDGVYYDEESIIAGSGEDAIALINIDGLIVESAPNSGFDALSTQYTSSRQIKKLLKDISNEQNVKGILLRVNSPGGSAAASDQIYEEIKQFKEQNDIPVVAYFTDTATSGSYYISMAADKIIANPANITGSIGVIVSYLSFAEFLERYGIQDVTYTSGEFKDLISQFDNPTEEEEAIIQPLVDDIYDRFVDVVASGRKMNKDEVLSLADGRIYSAPQAVSNGLIDDTGQLEDAFSEVKKSANLQQASLVEFGRQGFWDLVFESTSMKLSLPFMNNVKALPFSPGLNVMYLYK